MSAPAAPSWYDVLGVDADADTDTIRAAWRESIADLDPGQARFRSLNQAAEILLDAESKAVYDTQLNAETESKQGPDGSVRRKRGAKVSSTRPRSASPTATLDRDETSADPTVDLPGEVTDLSRPRTGPPTWLLIGLAILTVLLVAGAVVLFTQPSDDAIASSTDDAQSSAEKAATTILGYDYRQMDADQKAADALMTPSYAAKYNALFAQLKANAATIKPVVRAQVLASGIVRSGDDRVQVLVFVNRPTTRADGKQEVFHDQVRMTMVESGAGWLVDDLQTGAQG